MPLGKDVKLEKLADMCEGYTGADIEAVCREAAIIALRENLKAKEVKLKHFKEATKIIKPSMSKDEIESFRKKLEKIKTLHKPEELTYFG
jgi:transitional endoplasmic reticulum ATPase